MKKKQQELYDRYVKELDKLQVNDSVRIRPSRLNQKIWILGKIKEVLPFRSYKILTQTGSNIKRNRRDLRKTQEQFKLIEHDYDWSPS